MAAIRHLKASEFDKAVVKGLSLVDFWADWCQPCRVMTPVIEQFARESKEVVVFKVNVDEEAGLAQKYNILSIPTLLLFKDGKPVDQLVGVQPKEKLAELVRKYKE